MRNKYLPSRSTHNSHKKGQTIIAHFLHISKTINQLKQAHTLLLTTLTKAQQHHVLPHLLTHLLQVPGDNLCYARHMFDQIPNCKSQFLWTSFIRNHVHHAQFKQSLILYTRMHRMGISPSGFTFSSVLSACARIPAIVEGKQIHKRLVLSGFLCNRIVQTALLDMYAKCGYVADACSVFNTMDDKDVTAWTAMISGYTKVSMMDEARNLFDVMGEKNVVSWTTMVAGYANCGHMKAARELYEKMREKNTVTWIAMIAGYGKCGDVIEARKVFDETTERDASCWAAMVACYAQNGYAKEAIEIYEGMRKGSVRITEVAMVGAISACTQLGDAELESALAEHVDEGCCDRTLFVSNALIHMHAKCGCMDQAWREFNRMKERDVISYSTMITALADHGKSQEALDLFLKMQNDGIKPSQVTFVSVLNACSHGGLVEEGCKHFELMTKVFSVGPSAEHLTCMVDLLARAGQLERAYNLIVEYMGVASDAGIWGALLGACEVHGNLEIGEIAARHLSQLEPDNIGNYVLLANIYASTKKWDGAERVRQMMGERGLRKSPGCSWIVS